MSSGDTTGAPIFQKEKKSDRTDQRVSARYRKLVEKAKNKFTPIDVTVWMGDKKGGKMMKVTQHTAIKSVDIYGKREQQRGFIASIPGKNTKGYTRYFFVD